MEALGLLFLRLSFVLIEVANYNEKRSRHEYRNIKNYSS